LIEFSYTSEPVLIASGNACVAAVLDLPRSPCGIVLVPDEGGARRGFLAGEFRRAGLATLLIESPKPAHGNAPEPVIAQLCAQLAAAADWLATEPETMHLALGLHGSGDAGAAVLLHAASRPAQVAAVVVRGGRPDLAGDDALARVRTPTLLIVGEQDGPVIEYNRRALAQLHCEKDLAILRGTTNAQQSPRALDETARLATRWFRGYFGSGARPAA